MLRKVLFTILLVCLGVILSMFVFKYYKYLKITKVVGSNIFALDNLRLPFESYKEINGQYPNNKKEFDNFLKKNDSLFFDFERLTIIDYSIMRLKDSVIFYSWGYDNIDDSICYTYNLTGMTFLHSLCLQGDMIFSSFSLNQRPKDRLESNQNEKLPIPPRIPINGFN